MVDTKLKEKQANQNKKSVPKKTPKNIENKKTNKNGTKSTKKTADVSSTKTKAKDKDISKRKDNIIFEDKTNDKNNSKDKEATDVPIKKDKKNKRQLDKKVKYKLLFLNIITFFIFQLYLNAKIKKHTETKEDEPKTDQSLKSENNQKDLKHSSKIPFDIQKLIEYLGSIENIKSNDASLNSLQVFLKDKDKIDKEAIKKLGAKGLIVSKEKISIVFGDYSMTIRDLLNDLLKK